MAKEKKFVESITDMEVDFPQWYTDVVKKADLTAYSSLKGCMIIRPYGYAIWELLQRQLDDRFKETGVENVYMPMFIPESLLQKEKDHCARGCMGNPRRRKEAGGTHLCSSHFRNPVLRALCKHRAVLQRPAQAV